MAIVLLVGATLASTGIWSAGLAVDEPVAAIAAGLLTLACAAAALTLLRQPTLALRWTGHAFCLGDAGDAGRVEVAIDLGRVVLLRFVGPRSAWLPVSASSMDATAWHALRCAVHAGPPPPAEPAAPGLGVG